MRTAYKIVQQLMWNAKFRRRFMSDRKAAVAAHYPDYEEEGLFGNHALMEALEEEAYRRIAFLQRTCKEVFPSAHQLLCAYCGNAFFEDVLSRFFDLRFQTLVANALDILEPFDGYIVGPMLLQMAKEHVGDDVHWINGLMSYEWAVWHARRVALGWPPLVRNAPLVPGASLVQVDFDLKSLLAEAKRLEAFFVTSDLYRWRIVPSSGEYRAAIYPKNGAVVEAKLDPGSYAELVTAVSHNSCQINDELKSTVQSIGLILEASFLCCSNETAPTQDLATKIPVLVEPEPH